MKKTVTSTVELDLDELKEAVISYLIKHKIRVAAISNVDSIIKRIEIPGPHFHDCDFREEFNGVKVTCVYKTDVDTREPE